MTQHCPTSHFRSETVLNTLTLFQDYQVQKLLPTPKKILGVTQNSELVSLLERALDTVATSALVNQIGQEINRNGRILSIAAFNYCPYHGLKSNMEHRPFSIGSVVMANLFWWMAPFKIINISHSVTAGITARKQSRTHSIYYKGHSLKS